MKCKYCGKEIPEGSRRRKFCSEECYRKWCNDYRNEKAKRKYREDSEWAKSRNKQIHAIAKAKQARLRRETMADHARELVMLSHKGDAEELVTEYLLQHFNMRAK